jgi:hypothetical protein
MMDTADCGCKTDGEFTYHHRECYQPIVAALRARVAVLEKVISLYSALFRGVTQDNKMLILPKDAYDEINAALDALKEG